MAAYKCDVCDYLFDEAEEGIRWEDLPDDWECPVCGSSKSEFTSVTDEATETGGDETTTGPAATSVNQYQRKSDELEVWMTDIHTTAETGHSIIEPMRTKKPVISWDDILIKGAQLARIPLNGDEQVSTSTVIGPKAKRPMVIETPVYVGHMSFGALSREVKIALSMGSAAARTAMCSVSF